MSESLFFLERSLETCQVDGLSSISEGLIYILIQQVSQQKVKKWWQSIMEKKGCTMKNI